MIKKLKNPAIKDSKFIVVPKIYEDELLSSWFIRTAYAHHTSPHTFLQLHLSINSQILIANNFDVAISQENIQTLEQKSGLLNLERATLKTLSGYLQENIIDNGLNVFLCLLRYCPKCLKEEIVYFRKEWKIVFYTICIKHKCYLEDSCPKCSSEIQISRMHKDEKYFKYCYKCGFDLSKSKIKHLNENELFIKNTEKIYKIIRDGFIILKEQIIYSFLFFSVMLQINKKIIKHKNIKIINEYNIFKYIDFKRKFSNALPPHMYLSIKEQFAIFSIIMDLFEDYPNRFREFVLENKISHWQMIKDMTYIPYWYDELVNMIAPREIYRSKFITNEEIQNAKNYLISQGIEVNKSSMSRITGCNFHSSYNNLIYRLFNRSI
ncbi:TniQ family protein [Aliarcobacter skirrowii]|uniref:TniQ family protein n=1 Tax=Aliarcobacter skirrowii TaxID=28200 RepID=UPI0008301F75|nr:TniQ family protein [Aliarcobacter skirrowii]